MSSSLAASLIIGSLLVQSSLPMESPQKQQNDAQETEDDEESEYDDQIILIIQFLAIMVVVEICIFIFFCYYRRYLNGKKNKPNSKKHGTSVISSMPTHVGSQLFPAGIKRDSNAPASSMAPIPSITTGKYSAICNQKSSNPVTSVPDLGSPVKTTISTSSCPGSSTCSSKQQLTNSPMINSSTITPTPISSSASSSSVQPKSGRHGKPKTPKSQNGEASSASNSSK